MGQGRGEVGGDGGFPYSAFTGSYGKYAGQVTGLSKGNHRAGSLEFFAQRGALLVSHSAHGDGYGFDSVQLQQSLGGIGLDAVLHGTAGNSQSNL